MTIGTPGRGKHPRVEIKPGYLRGWQTEAQGAYFRSARATERKNARSGKMRKAHSQCIEKFRVAIFGSVGEGLEQAVALGPDQAVYGAQVQIDKAVQPTAHRHPARHGAGQAAQALKPIGRRSGLGHRLMVMSQRCREWKRRNAFTAGKLQLRKCPRPDDGVSLGHQLARPRRRSCQ